jgi:hypothetical protein
METGKVAVMGHLSDEALMDVLEGGERGTTAGHAASCADCAARLAEARQGLELTRAATVPDPPGAYWESFPRQVARSIAASPSRRPWGLWLVPGLAVAAAAVLAVALAVRPWAGGPAPSSPLAANPDRPSEPLPAWSPLPVSEEDPGLPVLQALGPEVVSAVECVGLAECLAVLSDEECQDLVQALRAGVKESRL